MVALPLFFSVGRYIPGFAWTLEIGILMSIGAAVLSTTNARTSLRHPFKLYIVLTAFGLPIIGSIAAYIVFGQPMLYGIASQRGCLLALFAYAMGNMITNERVTLSELERAIIILAWVNLIICAPVLIFLDPNDYNDLGSLVSDGGGVFNNFHLPMPFIILGALYYFSVWMVTGQQKYGFFAVPFILYVVAGNNGRMLNLTLTVALIAIAWISSPNKRLQNLLVALSLLIGIVLVIVTINPDKIGIMIAKYQDAFAAMSGAYEVDDISANARILQNELAWPYIYDSPIIGNGAVSNKWNGGYQDMFGYFHPSDLGIIGVIYVYGIFGVLFFGVQYVLFTRIARRIDLSVKDVSHGAFLLAMFANLLFMLFASFSAGYFVLVPEQTLFFFSVIFAQAQRTRCLVASR